MDFIDLNVIKENCLADLRSALGRERVLNQLADIDGRIVSYAQDCVRCDVDMHNLYELLGLRKFIRMLDTYPFNLEKVRKIFAAYETLKFSGLRGRTCYRLTPIQCFMFASTFGFMRSRDDWRRVVTEAVYFIPRKFSKTTIGAFLQFWFFFFEDANSEGYCVANSADQAGILFDLTYDLIHQLDPDEKRIRFTSKLIEWKGGQQRQSKVCKLSSGGKTKDGLFAQLVTADEYGSASYVKDKSDMANLLQVVKGSMGPRLEPLTVITTTAGRVTEGPFEIKLRGIKEDLLKEMDIPLDGLPHRTDSDWQYVICLQPDEWEMDDESLQQPSVWKKVNPHIGITVQPDYYAEQWREMLKDIEVKKEQTCKLFNVFRTSKVKEWIPAYTIRQLQVARRIEDLGPEWCCVIGQDFSSGDDLCGQSYLCYNTATGEMFADLDAWISEESLNNNSNSELYRLWAAAGWLHVCPGKTIDEHVVTNRVIELSNYVNIVGIGYDSYDAKRFVNDIKAWIFGLGEDPDKYVRPVSQVYSSYNSAVQELEYMVNCDVHMITFSASPLWPWEFANAVLDEDRMGNKKPIKRSANSKVDNVQCLCSAIILYDQLDGSAQK